MKKVGKYEVDGHKSLLEDTLDLLDWIEDGYYDTDDDLVAIIESAENRRKFLAYDAGGVNERGETVKVDELLAPYGFWWIHKRAELKRGGMVDKDMLPLIGASKLAAYAEVGNKHCLVFTSLSTKTKRGSVTPAWFNEDDGMVMVATKSIDIIVPAASDANDGDSDSDGYSREDLESMTLAELKSVCDDLSITAPRTKAKVVDAILDAYSAADESDDEDDYDDDEEGYDDE